MIPRSYSEYKDLVNEGRRFELQNIIKRNYISLNGGYKKSFYILEVFDHYDKFYIFLLPNGTRKIAIDIDEATYMDAV